MIGAKQILGVTSEAALRAKATEQARRTGADVVESAVPIAAYVNHGRWLADCSCGAAVACEPGIDIAVCFGHQDQDDPSGAVETRIHTSLVWPQNRGVIESALHKRPMNRNRNWRTDEDAAGLERENVASGLKG